MTEKSDTDINSRQTLSEKDVSPGSGSPKRKRIQLLVTWGLTGLLIAAIAILIAFGGFKKKEAPAMIGKKLVNVEVITVKTKEYRESLILPALVEADRVASIKPEFSGRLEKWYCAEGAKVKTGELVA